MTALLVTALLACNVFYFMPRQVTLHQDYTGLPAGYQLDVSAIYHPPLHNAIIITDDYFIYQFVLFPLNDPLLQGDVIYALASDPSQYTELRTAFPGRTLYRLDISPGGSVQYVALTG